MSAALTLEKGLRFLTNRKGEEVHPVLKQQAERLFQEYVTSIAFSLTLSKRQIGALKILSEESKDDWHCFMDDSSPAHALKIAGNFLTTTRSLEERWLVLYAFRPSKRHKDTKGQPRQESKVVITKAGLLVIELLKEAGMWMQEIDITPKRIAR